MGLFSNDDPGLTLTIFMTMSSLFLMLLYGWQHMEHWVLLYFKVCSHSAYPQHSGEWYRTNGPLVSFVWHILGQTKWLILWRKYLYEQMKVIQSMVIRVKHVSKRWCKESSCDYQYYDNKQGHRRPVVPKLCARSKLYYIWATSCGNLFLPDANNKGADQPAYPRRMISAFIVRCLDSTIPILAKSKISWL